MVKAMYIVHKRVDMEVGEFRRYWKEVHGPIAAKVPGLRRYVQNHAVTEGAAGTPVCDGVAELWFDSAEALQAALASPEGVATLADIPNFIDGDRSGMVVVEEVKVV